MATVCSAKGVPGSEGSVLTPSDRITYSTGEPATLGRTRSNVTSAYPPGRSMRANSNAAGGVLVRPNDDRERRNRSSPDWASVNASTWSRLLAVSRSSDEAMTNAAVAEIVNRATTRIAIGRAKPRELDWSRMAHSTSVVTVHEEDRYGEVELLEIRIPHCHHLAFTVQHELNAPEVGQIKGRRTLCSGGVEHIEPEPGIGVERAPRSPLPHPWPSGSAKDRYDQVSRSRV